LTAMESAFDDFYTARLPGLVHALFLAGGDLERAEDCAQEAFVRAWRQWRKLEGDDPVGWVRTVAWRLCVDDWRGRRRESAALAKLRGPHESRMDFEDVHGVLALLAGLPREQAVVLVLHYVEDLAVDEVAEVLRLPVGTVKSRLSRARDTLRKAQREMNKEV